MSEEELNSVIIISFGYTFLCKKSGREVEVNINLNMRKTVIQIFELQSFSVSVWVNNFTVPGRGLIYIFSKQYLLLITFPMIVTFSKGYIFVS